MQRHHLGPKDIPGLPATTPVTTSLSSEAPVFQPFQGPPADNNSWPVQPIITEPQQSVQQPAMMPVTSAQQQTWTDSNNKGNADHWDWSVAPVPTTSQSMYNWGAPVPAMANCEGGDQSHDPWQWNTEENSSEIQPPQHVLNNSQMSVNNQMTEDQVTENYNQATWENPNYSGYPQFGWDTGQNHNQWYKDNGYVGEPLAENSNSEMLHQQQQQLSENLTSNERNDVSNHPTNGSENVAKAEPSESNSQEMNNPDEVNRGCSSHLTSQVEYADSGPISGYFQGDIDIIAAQEENVSQNHIPHTLNVTPSSIPLHPAFAVTHLERTDSCLSGSSLQTFQNSPCESMENIENSSLPAVTAVDAVRQKVDELSLNDTTRVADTTPNSDTLSFKKAESFQATPYENSPANEEVPSIPADQMEHTTIPKQNLAAENSNVQEQSVDETYDGSDANAANKESSPGIIQKPHLPETGAGEQNDEGVRSPPDGAAAIRPVNIAVLNVAKTDNTQVVPQSVQTPPKQTNEVDASNNNREITQRTQDDNENVENLQTCNEPSSNPVAAGIQDASAHHISIYASLIGPREGSPFKPIPKSAASIPTVIQQELPDVPPIIAPAITLQDHGANLETTPDNVERPGDIEQLATSQPSVPKMAKSQESSPQRSVSPREVNNVRRSRDTSNESPSTTLWQNPEPAQNKVFLAPAAKAAPASCQQKVLIVPSLSDQQELLDNPLGSPAVASAVSNSNQMENNENVSQHSNTSAFLPSSVEKESSVIVDNKSQPEVPSSSTQIVQHVEPVDNSLSHDQKPKAPTQPVKYPSEPREIGHVPSQRAPQLNYNRSLDAAPDSYGGGTNDISHSFGRGARPPVPGLGSMSPNTRVVGESAESFPRSSAAHRRGQNRDVALQPYIEGGHREDGDYPRPSRQEEMDFNSGNWNVRSSHSRSQEAHHDHWRENDRHHQNYPSNHRLEHSRSYSNLPNYPENDTRGQPDHFHRGFREDPYRYYSDDPYYNRDRSRPSSRSSVEYDKDINRRGHDRERAHRMPYDDRPPSRGGYDSDHDSSYGRSRGYDYRDDYYKRDPRYRNPAYEYDRYGYDRYYQHYYNDPYYGYTSYNYGYYDELYRNDPRFRAQYDSRYMGYYGYDDYDRRSIQSGRSSANEEIQKERNKFVDEYHQPNPNQHSEIPQTFDQSTIYPDPNASYSQTDSYQYSQDFTFKPDASDSVNLVSPAIRLTPVKFSIPHVRASFTNNGHLIKILPNDPKEGQPSVIEIHEIQNLLESEKAVEEFKAFPGPLEKGQTHKNDVIQFCIQKAKKAREDITLQDRDSCALMWELLVLLIRQNGTIVGTDIAELLLKDNEIVQDELETSTTGDLSQLGTNRNNEANATDEGSIITKDRSVVNKLSEEKITRKFREFLLFGHKKDGLEWAMKNGLWGHALFLASKMDTRTHANIMTRFANSLALNDPLQTLYQLMSGRQPAAVTCVADSKWGDWRPHLAMILSNTSQRPELERKSITMLGDTLAMRGCIHAAHFCYLMAQLEFGIFSNKASKLVLLGSTHSLPFGEFATNEAIQLTEIYEYAQSLANADFLLPHFQSYKYIYATRLAEHGFSQEALHYCEVIASQVAKFPGHFHHDMVSQVYELATKLKYYDPHYNSVEEELTVASDPDWLIRLSNILQDYVSGVIQCVSDDNYSIMSSSNQTFNEEGDIPSQHDTAIGNTDIHYSTNAYQNVAEQSNTENIYSGNEYSQNHQPYYGNYEYQSNVDTMQNQNAMFTSQNQPQYTGENSYQTTNTQYGTDTASHYGSSYPPATELNNSSNDNSYPNGHVPNISSNVENSMDYWENMSAKKPPPPKPVSSSVPNDRRTSTSSNRSVEERRPKGQVSTKAASTASTGWFNGIFSKFMPKPKNQMKLPDDRNPKIIWDSKMNKWVNTDEDEEDTAAIPAAPPTDTEIFGQSSVNSPAGSGAVPPTSNFSGSNKFKRQPIKGVRGHYVDVIGQSSSTTSSSINSVPPPTNLFPMMDTQTSTTSQYFVPEPVSNSGSMMDFVSPAGHPQIGNPASRSASPNEASDDDKSEEPKGPVGGGAPQILCNPQQWAQLQRPTRTAGLSAKYGSRYPR